MPARKLVFSYIEEKFGAQGERIFDKHPEFAVFRHAKNQKWFAVFMCIDGGKLGLKSAEKLEILNLKLEVIRFSDLRFNDIIMLHFASNLTLFVKVLRRVQNREFL